jgi:hypothetical protein
MNQIVPKTQAVPNYLPAPPALTRLLHPLKETAYLLGISVRAVSYLISGGELQTRRIGGRTLVPHAGLAKFASCDHRNLICPIAAKAKVVL